jgi:hypothetical protein
VRTSRNVYKITPDEYAVLATKKVGIIGLSVSSSSRSATCTVFAPADSSSDTS